MGKGDKRGHAQRADGKFTLIKSQDITMRSVKFTFHTYNVSQNNSGYIVTGYGLECLGSIPRRIRISYSSASRPLLESIILLSNGD
jgi:hypothetical protein